MKNTVFLFALLFLYSCEKSNEVEEVADCNCVKTTYRYVAPSGGSTPSSLETLGSESVACQEKESEVVLSRENNGNSVYYKICCDNIVGGNICGN